MVDKISHLNRTARRLYNVFGREPTDEELGAELEINASRVAEMRVANNRPLSLDAPIGDEESNTFAEVIEDQNAGSPLGHLEAKAVTRVLRELITTLSPREVQILRARFGLDGLPSQNLEEVGLSLGVTRERVRQLQNRSLLKLRKLLEKLEKPATDPALSDK
jgi:RNA polymerase primary sigma factor